jgi:hypothetical protein
MCEAKDGQLECLLGATVLGPGEYYLRYFVEGAKVTLSNYQIVKNKLEEGGSVEYVYSPPQRQRSDVRVTINRLFGTCSMQHKGIFYDKTFKVENSSEPVSFTVSSTTQCLYQLQVNSSVVSESATLPNTPSVVIYPTVRVGSPYVFTLGTENVKLTLSGLKSSTVVYMQTISGKMVAF